MAWEIFNSLHTYCRAKSGFSGVDNVDTFFPKWDDRQESFLFAETFKYLYLMWDDPLKSPRFPLDKWVFNTEAHPLRIVDISPSSSSRVPILQGAWSWVKTHVNSLVLVMKNLLFQFI
jgi:mannosyl-oligosaccharide alpha-1,2-mannosidase